MQSDVCIFMLIDDFFTRQYGSEYLLCIESKVNLLWQSNAGEHPLCFLFLYAQGTEEDKAFTTNF